jgi:sugar transferase EpsL
MYNQFGKRLFDIILTILALSVLAPFIGLIALVVRVKLDRPIFFSQKRPGLNEKPFTLLKFRTMTGACDPQGNVRPGKNGKTYLLNKFRTMRELRDNNGLLLPDEYRLTALGKTLRKWSLDELPEFWNVIRGDISLVGPRPLLMQYLERYTPEQARRHEVKPGITGWAQVNGRNTISWEEKFKLDIWYVDHMSFRLDVYILLLTLKNVIKREGINQPGHATMGEFQGQSWHFRAH